MRKIVLPLLCAFGLVATGAKRRGPCLLRFRSCFKLSAPGSATISSVSTSSGPVAVPGLGLIDFAVTIGVSTPVPGGSVTQSPFGLGVDTGISGFPDDLVLVSGESIDFTLSSFSDHGRPWSVGNL